MNQTRRPSVRKFSSEGQKTWMTDDDQKILFGECWMNPKTPGWM
ncbi:hypothetical protein ACFPFU_03315 [Negadavirga shengliensis]|uniref:Uncharacterized protein n=1 Tax=Negadavirga shengliensis TaxID=1389218 RepID=A0ABV9SWE7_9BACT